MSIRKMNEIQALATSVIAQYGLDQQGWKFEWDNGKRRAGACHYNTRTISGSRHILPNASDAEITETILHEVAHALTPGHSHDAVWRRKLIEMGGTGARTHSMETPKGRYEVVCSACGVIGHCHQAQGSWKGTVNRPEGFAMYTHRKCGQRLWLRDTKGMGTTLPPQVVAVQVPVHATAAQITEALAGATKTATGPSCQCQCGGHTKGGKFLPGHDARHVSQVFERWIANKETTDSALDAMPTAALRAKLEKRIAAYADKHYPKES